MLKVGDVIVLFAGTIRNRKFKHHVCVHVGRGWFFRINRGKFWPGSMPLLNKEESFLDQDRYLECGSVVEFDDYEIEDALKEPKNHKGRLSESALTRLRDHLTDVRSLTQEEKEAIITEIEAALRL